MHLGRITSLIFVWAFLFSATGRAAWTGPRPVHPLGWMHMLPGGETPGWSSETRLEVGSNVANIWNAPLTLLNAQNSKTLTYAADFEQVSTYVEKGFAVTPWFAMSIEGAYAHRHGGGLDRFIDDFHVDIDSHRFRRQYYDTNKSYFQATSDGVGKFTSESSSGLSNWKLKLKVWPVQLRQPNSNCPCGIGFSAQIKFPGTNSYRGLSSGHTDISGLVHVGIPLGVDSRFFLTTGVTTLGDNPAFADWPRRRAILMFDSSLDLNISGGFGLLLHAHAGSPLIDQTPLAITYPEYADPNYKEQRLSTGWNSLVFWRIYESLGLRWRSKGGTQISLMFTEDLGINDYDEVGDWLYVNNSPDIMATAHLLIPF